MQITLSYIDPQSNTITTLYFDNAVTAYRHRWQLGMLGIRCSITITNDTTKNGINW